MPESMVKEPVVEGDEQRENRRDGQVGDKQVDEYDADVIYLKKGRQTPAGIIVRQSNGRG